LQEKLEKELDQAVTRGFVKRVILLSTYIGDSKIPRALTLISNFENSPARFLVQVTAMDNYY
jgi:hypothetical protein